MEPTVIGVSRKKIMLWTISMVFTIGVVSFLTLGILLLRKDTIYVGVYIETVNTSDLTKEEARERLETIYEEQLNAFKLNLVREDYQKQLAYKELGYTYDYEEAVEKAYRIGRTGNTIKRIQEIHRLKDNPIYISMELNYDAVHMDDIMEDIEVHINREAKDATILRRNGAFHITKEQIGMEVDKKVLIDKIQKNIQRFSQEDITIPIIYNTPRITEEKLLAIKDVLGQYSTTFNAQQSGRSENIAIAARSINNTLLMPQEEFSFNKQTGPRGIAGGYQEAPVIINGELVPGVGGGICQVSSTLYNAVARSNLEVSDRRNHSLPVAYVPLGQDATVAGDYIDFKFINNRQYPVYVESFVQNSSVFVRIHGKKEDNIKVTLVSEIIETIEPKIEIKKDDTLLIGEKEVIREAKKGFRVNTYKVYTENGRQLKREYISTDRYVAVDGIIVEGTKPKEKNKIEAGVETEKQQKIEKAHEENPIEDEVTPIEEEIESEPNEDDQVPSQLSGGFL